MCATMATTAAAEGEHAEEMGRKQEATQPAVDGSSCGTD